MTRLFTVLAVIALVSLGVLLYCGRISPEARAARPCAQQLAQILRSDARFTNVEVRVWKLGSKGPLYVHGRVRSDSDAAELRHSFDALGCPVGVSWQVVVDTNLTGGVR